MSSIVHELRTVVDLLEERNRLTPERIAFTYREGDQETVLTYRELAIQSKKQAASLAAFTRPGDKVALLHNSGIQFIISFFACLYSRTVVVPLEIPKPSENLSRLQYAVRMSGAEAVLTTRALLNHISALLDDEEELLALQWIAADELPDIPFLGEEADRHEAAFIQFTSGTTSTSKGVILTHDNLLHNVGNVTRKFGLTEQDTAVIWLPLYHNLGLIGGVLAPLFAGFPVHLVSPQEILRRPALWLELITQKQATISGGPNFAFDLCLAHVDPEAGYPLNLSSWEIAFCGAEPVRSRTIEGFSRKFAPYGFKRSAMYPCYGLAESTLIVSGGKRDAEPLLLHCDPAGLEQNLVTEVPPSADSRTLVSCGAPVEDQDLVIVEPGTRTELPENAIGEIWLRSRSIAMGYLNDRLRTAETFEHVLENGDGGYLRTGDTGFLRNGELYIVGRIKNLLIVRGKNFYSNDLEAFVQSFHPGFQAGAVFAVDMEDEEQVVVLQEVEGELAEAGQEMLVKQIRHELARAYGFTPFEVVLLASGSLPKTVSGKVKHYECKQAYLGSSLSLYYAESAAAGGEAE
ncbi:fatty acyl-AMP ligase [Paenibacillus tritici]|uniref:Fatty acyl-AMP ligase n=1 Tax=Paenibacillus tritici TaxID=1873425 RepID=A0ABX2DJ82_9BACL|nr:fatty acyl-AMP ligase [Paenibacillus tritici]NQX44118.1 fatty acyl-AMP ligase [Paenibacillus tritici]